MVCFIHTILELFCANHTWTPKKKQQHLTQMQGAQKDVERAFGVFQVWWAIIQNPCRLWDMFTISNIMLTCVIMHNMVIEDEGLNNMQGFEHVTSIQMCRKLTFNSYMEIIEKLENQNKHLSLWSYLVEHLWALKGSNFAWNKTWFLKNISGWNCLGFSNAF